MSPQPWGFKNLILNGHSKNFNLLIFNTSLLIGERKKTKLEIKSSIGIVRQFAVKIIGKKELLGV